MLSANRAYLQSETDANTFDKIEKYNPKLADTSKCFFLFLASISITLMWIRKLKIA